VDALSTFFTEKSACATPTKKRDYKTIFWLVWHNFCSKSLLKASKAIRCKILVGSDDLRALPCLKNRNEHANPRPAAAARCGFKYNDVKHND